MAAKIKVNFKRPKPLEQIASASSTPFANFSSVVDVSGKLHFSGKASVDNEGITFQNGTSYKVKIEDFEQEGVLGRGQFGIVQKVVYKPTKVVMALKEIRLELDQNKLNHIIMELDVLHKSDHPNIIKFYGAFTVENCVYIALENMDAGSLDILYKGGVEEAVLAKM